MLAKPRYSSYSNQSSGVDLAWARPRMTENPTGLARNCLAVCSM